MLAAFFAVLGIALALKTILKLNIGEGMFLAAGVIVLSLYLGGLAGFFAGGMYVLLAIAAAGYLLAAYDAVRNGTGRLMFLRSPYFILVFLFFLYCLAAYYNDFIQHIDEFHQWAYTVKYMLESNLLPEHSALVGNQNPYATGLFYLFFQRITGYNEQNMYVASSLLVWIGLMLPFSGDECRDWKKAVLYCLIMYFGLYSLYIYGVKNLYVDLPVCAWAGGLAGWWMNRRRKKINSLILACGLLMICFFKWMAGPLMALFVILFLFMQTLFLERGFLSDAGKRRTAYKLILSVAVILVLMAAAVGVWMIKAPDTAEVLGRFLGKTITKDRIASTVSAFSTAAAGRPLSSRSNLKITFVPFLIVIAVLMKLTADVHEEKRTLRVYLLYLAGSAGAFMAVLLYAYLAVFNAEEAARMAGGVRYMSLYAVYIFILVLAWAMQKKETTNVRMQEYLALGLLLVFLAGVNEEFIPNATALNSSEVNGYKEIKKSKKQAKKIQKTISDEDKVYMLDQKGKNEYAKTTALYYLGEQVSNYIAEPWKFTPDGNVTRMSEQESPGIDDFPELLEEGGYTYLWIYKTDDYLSEKLPEVISCDDEIGNGDLYQIVYEDGEAAELEQIW